LAKELQLNPEDIRKEVYLSKDTLYQTAWQLATDGNPFELLEKPWEFAKELQLNQKRLGLKCVCQKAIAIELPGTWRNTTLTGDKLFTLSTMRIKGD
jgi:hypothetical protein